MGPYLCNNFVQAGTGEGGWELTEIRYARPATCQRGISTSASFAGKKNGIVEQSIRTRRLEAAELFKGTIRKPIAVQRR
jgi:hypothetical protein